MRTAFAHEAILTMDTAADLRAPGGAITIALCGAWEHEPPCPLAAHHTTAVRRGDEVRVRILFASEPGSEKEVRRRIDDALGSGHLRGPNGVVTSWQLMRSAASTVTSHEAAHAGRLTREVS